MSIFSSQSQDKTKWEGGTRESSELLSECQFPDFSVLFKLRYTYLCLLCFSWLLQNYLNSFKVFGFFVLV